MQYEIGEAYDDPNQMLAAIHQLEPGTLLHITFATFPDVRERELAVAGHLRRLCSDRGPLELVYEAQVHNLDFIVTAHALHDKPGLGWSGCFAYKVRVLTLDHALACVLANMVRAGEVKKIEKLTTCPRGSDSATADEEPRGLLHILARGLISFAS